MRSLRTRLSVAFIAVAVLATVLSAVFASYQARRTFRQYVEHREAPAVSAPAAPGAVPPAPRVQREPERAPMGAREILFQSRIRDGIWTGTGVAALIGVMLALWLADRMVRRVSDLTGAARVIARGGTPPPVPVHGQDEIAELARAFNRMAERLAADEEQRRRLFAGVAHELRTPLSVIQGTLEGMLDRVLDPTPERIAALHSQSLLLARLITDLRDLSLAQAGQLQLNVRPVDAGPVVRETLEAMSPLAEERHVTLRADVPQILPRIDADPDRLRQIVQNLVENAVRYTPEGGEVRVRMDAANGTGLVRLSVADTGVGIEARDLPYLFRHFYRPDQSRARTSGGTGLGLAIVKSLVEAHGGQVSVESAVGKGSTFTITFPRREEAVPAQEALA
jgi:two-component system sensor histidine kinase BaeS